MSRRIIRSPRGLELVPVDPPLLADELLIDLSGLTEERVPVSRAVTARLDEAALEALLSVTRSAR